MSNPLEWLQKLKGNYRCYRCVAQERSSVFFPAIGRSAVIATAVCFLSMEVRGGQLRRSLPDQDSKAATVLRKSVSE